MSAMSGIDEKWIIIACGILVGLYTVFGGIEAVIWTDVVQTIILMAGGLLLIGIVICSLPGGVSRVIGEGISAGKFSLGPMEWKFGERTFPVMVLIGLTSFVGEYASNQNVIQRYIAAKSLHEARKATVLCACCSVPTWTFFFFLGTCIFVYYKVFPSEIVASMPVDEILPHFVLTKTPPGVGGVIIAACLAAGMSSLDSSINSIATVFTVDFVRKYRPGMSDRRELFLAKMISGFCMVMMIAGALGISMLSRESVFDLSMILGALLCSASLTPFLLGFFTTRVGNRAILAGMVVAIIFSIYNLCNYFRIFPDPFLWKIHIYMAGLLCNLLMLVTALIYSIFSPEKKQDGLMDLTVWTMKSHLKPE